MKSSGSSSATETTLRTEPQAATPAAGRTAERSRFTLTGPSAQLDPTTHAVRRDLADIRLADRVFAPHYAAPALRTVTRAAQLRSAREVGSASLAALIAGDRFELLEIAGDQAWGVAPAQGLVGYLDADALGPA